MSDPEIESKGNGIYRWFSGSNVGIYTLLVAILAAVMGFSFHINSGISANGVRIDKTNELIDKTNELIDKTNELIDTTNELIIQTNKRIDETNKRIDETNMRIDETNMRIDETNMRIDSVQNMLTDLSDKVVVIENNDSNQDRLLEQQNLETKEVFDRLSQLELDQAGGSQ